eukprot:TRINITY_DN61543_c0_g1_i1.p2 TRINITY_DN61543_c0_g1~~TRINITY_DN61543_c0_g1_i1.p2  ORF type:complete len:363 (-),score=47.35 TRINITY_DN61543_c0_g1_i1:2374-3462(-)
MAAAESSDPFLETFNQLTEVLVKDAQERIGEKAQRLTAVLQSNTIGGKLTRGRTVESVVKAYFAAQKEESGKRKCVAPEDDPVFIARLLGWCVELLQAYFLVEDDIMDGSLTRRGQPCWYKTQGVAMAVNDGLLLRSMLFRTVKKYTSTKPYYWDVMELFMETGWLTELGQMLDVMSEQTVEKDQSSSDPYQSFSIDTWRNIVEHKTCYYTFYLPLALGLTVVGALGKEIKDADLRKHCLLIGTYFQAKDDELDCFGDPKLIGKVGTDIQDTKCSWLAATFLSKATAEQKKTFQDNYGKNDDAKVAVIKQLYKDTKIQEAFGEYEANVAKEMETILSGLESALPWYHTAFSALWVKTYKRTK